MNIREIKFSPPDISNDEIEEVIDALKSGWITTGPKTKKLEEEVSKYCETEKTASFNSATAALEMTLRALGVGEGDEVITSAYTYTASASVINHVGAKIVLVDVDKDSFFFDMEALENAITEKTKVVIPVDIAGVMADYDKIYEILERKKDLFTPSDNKFQQAFDRVIVLADAAHSFGASYKGKMSGNVADFSVFSFHAVKNLTTAEGGALTWKSREGIDNEELYKEFMVLSLHGQTKDALAKMKLGSWEYDIVAPNFKCNMTDIHAAIGLAQMKRYGNMLQRRKEIINKYDAYTQTKGFESIKHYTEECNSSGHLYLLRLTGKDMAYRNKLIEKMAEKGVSTNVHYKPLPLLTAYKNLGFDIADYPNANEVFENEITLPLHTLLTDEDVDYVLEMLDESLEELK